LLQAARGVDRCTRHTPKRKRKRERVSEEKKRKRSTMLSSDSAEEKRRERGRKGSSPDIKKRLNIHTWMRKEEEPQGGRTKRFKVSTKEGRSPIIRAFFPSTEEGKTGSAKNSSQSDHLAWRKRKKKAPSLLRAAREKRRTVVLFCQKEREGGQLDSRAKKKRVAEALQRGERLLTASAKKETAPIKEEEGPSRHAACQMRRKDPRSGNFFSC